MAEQKTKPTEQSVESFLKNVTDEKVREDCFALIGLMQKVTGATPKMWGSGIIAFGKYHYKYDSGHEGDTCLTGFSPRKQHIVLYIMSDLSSYTALLEKLGKYKAGKGCLYIKKLADVDRNVLESLITQSVDSLKKKYPDK
ncbi:DUF1801 domain-containing protein [Chitinophaga niastensis]|nr:DUF1801 domain-containing protein [Chitinophaga niastensis]